MVGHVAHGADDTRLDAALGALVAALVLAAGPAPTRVVGCRQHCGRLAHGGKATGNNSIGVHKSHACRV